MVRSILIILSVLFSLNVSATNYYVRKGAGASDSNNGTSDATAWAGLNKVNGFNLQAGDTVFFRRGDLFTGTLNPIRSGSAAAQIVFTAYGTGDRPKFSISKPGGYVAGWSSCINPYRSYLTFDNLHLTDTGINAADDTHAELAETGQGVNIEPTSHHIIVQNCTIDLVGVGVTIRGWYCKVLNCTISNTRMIRNDDDAGNNDYGALAILISGGRYYDIVGNYTTKCWGPSFDYDADGGFMEGDRANNGYISRNKSIENNGFTEIGATTAGSTNYDNLFEYNYSVNNGIIAFFHLPGGGAFAGDVLRITFNANTFIESAPATVNSQYLFDGHYSGQQKSGIVAFNNNVVSITKSGSYFFKRTGAPFNGSVYSEINRMSTDASRVRMNGPKRFRQ